MNNAQLEDKMRLLRADAVRSEKANQEALSRIGVSAAIIADKQYWTGYLDAINNIEKRLKQ